MAYQAFCTDCGAVEMSTCHCTLTGGTWCDTCTTAMQNFHRRHYKCDPCNDTAKTNEKALPNSAAKPAAPKQQT